MERLKKGACEWTAFIGDKKYKGWVKRMCLCLEKVPVNYHSDNFQPSRPQKHIFPNRIEIRCRKCKKLWGILWLEEMDINHPVNSSSGMEKMPDNS